MLPVWCVKMMVFVAVESLKCAVKYECYSARLVIASCAIHLYSHRLIGLLVKESALRVEDPGFESHLRQDFSRSSHTSDLKIGTPMATVPGAWRYRVSTGTGRPGVSILWLDEVESLIFNFYLSVAARTIVWADPSPRYPSMLLGC